MYQQSLPAAEGSIASAGMWARNVAATKRPELVEQTERIARDLVTQAVRRTPTGELITAQIKVSPSGLHIEVRCPAPIEQDGAPEWSDISTVTMSFGTRHDSAGHSAWADLRIAS